MIPDIWLFSDPHWGHKSILSFTGQDNITYIRPQFSSVEEMDETMITNWNKVVSPSSKIYCLGDVAGGSKKQCKENLSKILPRLNGKKRLILGNHDTIDVKFYREHFQKVLSSRKFHDDERNLKIIASHIPIHPSSLYPQTIFHANIHGHIHEKKVMISGTNLPDNRYINVSVEQTNYTPVSLKSVFDQIAYNNEMLL